MKYQLTAHEARVIGCLLEKQVTTPEQYPLSVNAVVTACNQKTNREPVMSLSESDIQDLLDKIQFDTRHGKIWFEENRMLLMHSRVRRSPSLRLSKKCSAKRSGAMLLMANTSAQR